MQSTEWVMRCDTEARCLGDLIDLFNIDSAANENRFFASNAIDQNKSVLANQMP